MLGLNVFVVGSRLLEIAPSPCWGTRVDNRAGYQNSNHLLLGLYNHGFQYYYFTSNNQPEIFQFVPGSFMKPNGSLILEIFKYLPRLCFSHYNYVLVIWIRTMQFFFSFFFFLKLIL